MTMSYPLLERDSLEYEERPCKRPRLLDLTERYRDGLMLAPMVRSGARKFADSSPQKVSRFFTVPTRLMALKYGAKLVWGPEVIDKAILHATRNVDRECHSIIEMH
jgi:tRNA-dihydrouridine synthase 2